MARSTPPAGGQPRGRRTFAQRLLLGVNILLVVACVGTAAAFTKVRATLASVPVVDIGSSLTPPPPPTEPRNLLIIGTDSAARLDDTDPVTKGRGNLGRLADVVMILRVDPRDHTARLLSIPRDTRLAIAPDGRLDRINTAIAGANGQRNLIRTIKRNFGISIDNYVQVDFLAFKQLVDVLGGVPVYLTTPVRDRNTGLWQPDTGCRLLDPPQALAYARARHFQFKEDGKWKSDGTGDLGRITRQQDFIKRALRRASDKGIRNPGTAVSLVNAATDAVLLDSTLDVGTILQLVKEFRNFNPDTLQTDQIPTRAAPRGGIAYQEVVWDEARPLLPAFRGVAPGARPAPADVIVDVRAPERRAADLAKRLDRAKFDAEGLDANSSRAGSKIVFGPEGRDAALLLAAQLDPVPTLELDPEIVGFRVVLNVGTDDLAVRSTPVPLTELPPNLAPTTSSTTTVRPTTTTTAPDRGDGSSATGSGGGGSSTTAPPTSAVDPTDSNRPAPPGVVPTDPAKAASCH